MSLYDPLTEYCPVLHNLERKCFDLVGRLAFLTNRLMEVMGNNHVEFALIKDECRSIRGDIQRVREELETHRADHGC